MKLEGIDRALDASERIIVEDGSEKIVADNTNLVNGRISNIVAVVQSQSAGGSRRKLQSTSNSITLRLEADYYGNDFDFNLHDTFSGVLDLSNQDLINLWISLRDQQLGGVGENIFEQLSQNDNPAGIVGSPFANNGSATSGLGGGAYAGLIVLSVFAVTLAIAASVYSVRQFHQRNGGGGQEIVITTNDIENADIEASMNARSIQEHGSDSDSDSSHSSSKEEIIVRPLGRMSSGRKSSMSRMILKQSTNQRDNSLDTGALLQNSVEPPSQTPKRVRDSPKPEKSRVKMSPSPKRPKRESSSGRRLSGKWLLNSIGLSPNRGNKIPKDDAPQAGSVVDIAARRAMYESDFDPPAPLHNQPHQDPTGNFTRSRSRLSTVSIKDRISQFEKLSETGPDVGPQTAPTLLGRLGTGTGALGAQAGAASEKARAFFNNMVSGVAAGRQTNPDTQANVQPLHPLQDLAGHPGMYHVLAPPGAVGIIVDTSPDGPAVHSLKSASPMLGLISPGDLIVALDDEDTRHMTAAMLTRLMAQKSTQRERKITLLTVE